MLKKIQKLFRSPIKWHATLSSETGPNRPHNEDCALLQQNKPTAIAIVCDGVGGNNAGEVASQLCCTIFASQLKPKHINPQGLKQAIKSTHQKVVEQGNLYEKTRGMATTLVAYIQNKHEHWIVWVGDSRAYLLNKENQLSQISDDHSFVAEKVAQGIFTQEEAEKHPMASMITSSIGGNEKGLRHIGIKAINPNKGDKIILVSDGVYGYIDMQQATKQGAQNAQQLTQLAIDANTSDNCSAILVEIS